MSIVENKMLVRRLCEEVYDQGNVELIDELFAPSFVEHDPSQPSGRVDRE
jgi:hypothetical protein